MFLRASTDPIKVVLQYCGGSSRINRTWSYGRGRGRGRGRMVVVEVVGVVVHTNGKATVHCYFVAWFFCCTSASLLNGGRLTNSFVVLDLK